MKQKTERVAQSAKLRNVPPPVHQSTVGAAKVAQPNTAAVAPRSIELHIEELVLHGFAPDNHEQFAAAVESELTRLLTERGIPSLLTASGEVEQLGGSAFRIQQGEQAEVTGQHLAKAIYTGVKGGLRA